MRTPAGPARRAGGAYGRPRAFGDDEVLQAGAVRAKTIAFEQRPPIVLRRNLEHCATSRSRATAPASSRGSSAVHGAVRLSADRDPQLGMERPSVRPSAPLPTVSLVDGLLRREAGGGDVEGFFEVGAVERVGLVEDRDDLDDARGGGSLPPPPPARCDEPLDEERGVRPARPRPRGWRGCARPPVVRPPAESARMTPRLPDSEQGFTTTGGPSLPAASATPAESPGSTTTKSGWGTPAADETPARMAALSLVRATAAGGLWARPSSAARQARRREGPESSTAMTASRASTRRSAGLGDDAAGRLRRIVERQLDETLAHLRRQRLRPFGCRHDLDAEALGRRQVLVGPVGAGREDEKGTWHGDHDARKAARLRPRLPQRSSATKVRMGPPATRPGLRGV